MLNRKRIVRNLVAAAVAGTVVGGLVWLSFGDDFWRGFMAGLVVEEFMQIAPGATEFLIVRSARWAADDPDEVEARAAAMRRAVDGYPGRVIKLIAAAFIIVPSLVEGSAKRIRPRVRLKKVQTSAIAVRTLRTAGTLLARLLIILAVAAFIGGSAIVFWQSGADAIQRQEESGAVDISLALNLGGVLVAVVGVGSVLMLIYGGFRYVTSGGDAGNVSSAKNSILYAIIGLVFAIATFSLIQGIISALT